MSNPICFFLCFARTAGWATAKVCDHISMHHSIAPGAYLYKIINFVIAALAANDHYFVGTVIDLSAVVQVHGAVAEITRNFYGMHCHIVHRAAKPPSLAFV
jgi:hypothetical protein